VSELGFLSAPSVSILPKQGIEPVHASELRVQDAGFEPTLNEPLRGLRRIGRVHKRLEGPSSKMRLVRDMLMILEC